MPIAVADEAVRSIARFANGDARVALNLLEFAAASAPAVDGVARIDEAFLKQSIERRALLYDKAGEEHYNLISALHKSMRNSDPDAGRVLARAHARGRRGPALHRAAAGAVRLRGCRQRRPAGAHRRVAAKEACHFIGMPEGNTALTQAVTYLATAPKSNAVYKAYLQGRRRTRTPAARSRCRSTSATRRRS